MKLNAQTPKQSLNKAFLKQPVNRDDITLFKTNLQTLLGKINDKESEEHHKNFIRDFLKDTFYKSDYEINTKGRQDLVIHVGKNAQEKVGVILEAKKPTNKADMISADNPNRKALHELVLYFLRERIDGKNADVKYLIITNINEWFIFDASVFNQLFFENKVLVKDYKEWRDRQKTTVKTDLFYNEIAKPYIDAIEREIPCTYFDIRNYDFAEARTLVRARVPESEDTLTDVRVSASEAEFDKKLIELFKILSPQHLLKVPFADDSNKLDKNFYTELLHIVGLEETKDKGKLKIDRKAEERRDAGSLIENAITIIKTDDLLTNVTNLESYGETRDERLFGVALELCLTWINRVLFLKLLEAQLVDYHKGNRDYRFLDVETIQDFDGLYRLFHQVLAINLNERIPQVKEKFSRVPYLNSSLFEPTDLEKQTLRINALNDKEALSFNSASILKDSRNQQNGLPTLEYLFKFLDAYDFASEGVSGVKENNRSLINASVLGKIFEKVNNAKAGSIYTPGFITMYMCRQAIRLAIVQKFKDKYEIDIDTFEDLEIYVSKFYKTANILEFNELINSLHLCDPAVGSGHFLVSSLNEIIAIKSKLGILADASGKPFPNIEITIENDELIVFDTAKSEFFKYQITEGKPNSREAQRLQKTLFHEKQTIIENCLFGVDIIPHSVKICRLRLWIELLKNAYYKDNAETRTSVSVFDANENALTDVRASAKNFSELETLPNIDINIKTGNSLVSRFALDEDLKEVLNAETRTSVSVSSNSALTNVRASAKKKNIVEQYRTAVADYKRERNRDKKRELLKIIDEIKGDFQTEIYKHHPKMVELARRERRLFEINSPQLFDKYSAGERETLSGNLEKQISEIKQEIEAIKSNVIYRNAFEWRFEFPEVLDDEGNFTGFDIVIGNPPYIRQEELGKQKEHLKKDYRVFTGTADILVYFYELGLRVLKQNGKFSFITSNKFMRANYGKPLRNFLGNYQLDEIIDFGDAPVFGGVAAYASIVNLQKCGNTHEVSVSSDDANVRPYSVRASAKDGGNTHEVSVSSDDTDERPYSVRASANGGEHQTRVYTFPKSGDVPDFEASYKADGFNVAQKELTPNGWRLEQTDVLDLLAKLRSKGKPLGEYVNGRFYYGIKTGFNEAFVVDRETKDRLIAEDSSSAEVLKPYLRGRDVKRWNVNYEDLYLIKIESSSNKKHAWSGKENQEAEQVFSETYPAIYRHFQNYRSNLIQRGDKGTYFWELRACIYWNEFEQTKIIYPNICDANKFAWDEDKFLTNQKAFIIPKADKFLLGYLNSKIVFWLFDKLLSKLLNDYFEPSTIFMEKLPIPKVEEKDQQPFVALVDQILELKKAGKDTVPLENEIDRLVYRLYDLTDDEIQIVEGK